MQPLDPPEPREETQIYMLKNSSGGRHGCVLNHKETHDCVALRKPRSKKKAAAPVVCSRSPLASEGVKPEAEVQRACPDAAPTGNAGV